MKKIWATSPVIHGILIKVKVQAFQSKNVIKKVTKCTHSRKTEIESESIY